MAFSNLTLKAASLYDGWIKNAGKSGSTIIYSNPMVSNQ